MTRLRYVLGVWLLMCASAPLAAQNPGPGGLIVISLDSACKRVSEIFQVEINRNADLLRRKKVSVSFLDETSPEAALRHLLQGTGYTYCTFPAPDPAAAPTYGIQKGKQEGQVVRGIVNCPILDKERSGTRPLQGANVSSLLTGHTIKTTRDGAFEIPSTVNDTLTIWYDVYQSRQKVPVRDPAVILRITIPNPREQNYHLTDTSDSSMRAPFKGTRGQVQTVAIRPPQTTLTAASGGRTFRLERIEDFPALSAFGEEDPLRALEALPGVLSTSESLGQLSIRGGEGDQNLVLLDGIPVYSPQHMLGTVGLFNNKAVAHVDVQPGNFPVRFGGRTSGVIALEGRPGNPRNSRRGVNYGANLLSMSLGGELPIRFGGKVPPLALSVAVRRSFADFWFSPAFNRVLATHLQGSPVSDDQQVIPDTSDQYREATDPTFFFWDVNAKLAWMPQPNHHLSLTLFKAHDRLQYEVSRPGVIESHQELLEVDNEGASVNWTARWGQKRAQDSLMPVSHTALVASRNQNQHQYNFDSPDFQEEIAQQYQIDELSFQHRTTWAIDKQHQIELGWKWDQLSLGNDSLRTRGSIGVPDTLADVDKQHLTRMYAHFAEYAFHWPKRLHEDGFWRVVSGLRHTFYQATQRHYWEPRLELSRTMANGLKIKTQAGRYAQFLRQVQANFDVNVGEQVFGLAGVDELPVLWADQVSIGGSYAPGRAEGYTNWMASLAGYVKRYDGLAMYVYEQEQVLDGTEPTQLLGDGTGWVRGLDAMFQLKHKGLEGWLSYSYSRAINRFDSVNAGSPFPAITDRPHQVNLVWKVDMLRSLQKGSQENTSHQWVFSGNWTYATGRPFTPLYAVSNVGFASKLWYAEVHSDRLPAYHRLDLSLHYAHYFKSAQPEAIPGVKGKIGLVCFNVYNRANINQRRYRIPPANPQDASQTTFTVIDQGLLGVSPNIFITLEF